LGYKTELTQQQDLTAILRERSAYFGLQMRDIAYRFKIGGIIKVWAL